MENGGVHIWIKKLNLPIYRPTGLHPLQKEISIKGALFPDRILGIELVDKKQFVVNPNLFNFEYDEMESLIMYKKIPTNQEDFSERMKDTNSENSVYRHDDYCGLVVSVDNK